MTVQLDLLESNIFMVLGRFLQDVTGLPSSCVVQGQINRVPEPRPASFIVMYPIAMPRMGTNYDSFQDAVFTGFISGTTLTITDVNPDFTGTLLPGITIFGPTIEDNTTIVRQLTQTGEPGGIGTYKISIGQNVSSGKIAAGVKTMLKSEQVIIQVDVHGPDATDNTNKIETCFFDQFGVDDMAQPFGSVMYDVAPLYIDDPKQLPFTNEQNQVEKRWMLQVHLQANPIVTVPQQFADMLKATVIDATKL